MSQPRRTLKELHQLALARLGPSSAALKTRQALEAALAAVPPPPAPPPTPAVSVGGFEVRAPLVIRAPFRPLEAPVLPGPFGDDQVLVFPRDGASVLVSWDLAPRGPAVLQVREGGVVLRRVEGLRPMGTLQLEGLGDAHTITVELSQATQTVGRSQPLMMPGRTAVAAASPGSPGAQEEGQREAGGSGARGSSPTLDGQGSQALPQPRRASDAGTRGQGVRAGSAARAGSGPDAQAGRTGARASEPASSRTGARASEPASSRTGARASETASKRR